MRINLFVRPAVAVFCAAVLGGCVTIPPQQSFNRAAHTDIKTISVLPASPTELHIFMLNNPAASFGLIGALVAAGDQASMEKKENQIFAPTGFEPMAYFKQKLTDDMRERGYRLIWPDTMVQTSKVDRGPYGLRKSYPQNSNADAMLDVNFGFYGFAASGAGSGSPYRPTVTVGARLIGRDGKQNYFTDYIIYNNVFNDQKAIAIKADEHYTYPKFKDLESAGTTPVEGLKLALDSIASKLAEQL